jgi:hypothetical protein
VEAVEEEGDEHAIADADSGDDVEGIFGRGGLADDVGAVVMLLLGEDGVGGVGGDVGDGDVCGLVRGGEVEDGSGEGEDQDREGDREGQIAAIGLGKLRHLSRISCPAGRARYARGDHFVVCDRFAWPSRWSVRTLRDQREKYLRRDGLDGPVFGFFVALLDGVLFEEDDDQSGGGHGDQGANDSG